MATAKLSSVAALLSLVLISSANGASADTPLTVSRTNDCEIAWNRLFAKFWVPKTGLLYEHLPDETPGSVTRFVPTPSEIAKNEPIATGWCTGMEDGVLNGCPLVLAAMLRGDAAAVEKLVPGILRCATVSKVPGFLARSLSPADGTSHYADSSRDQYTLFIYTMWRYANSRFCPAARRREIVRIVTDIARYAERGMTAANAYTLLREDGRPGLVSQMWMPDPKAPIAIDKLERGHIGKLYAHEAERLPMIYAAAYALTGDGHWRERELAVADDALRLAESGSLDGYVGFALYQMQVSQRLLWERESDPARRERYRKLLHRAAASACRKGLNRAQGLMDGLKGYLGAPAGDWRMWPVADVSPWAGGRDGILSRLDAAYIARFRALSHRADFGRVMSPGLVYPVLAEAMLQTRRLRKVQTDIFPHQSSQA